ncbi:WAT1-related protein At1g09380-like [Rhodamnia argentea]|uniref:WAT1-related protein n=1 Tax=Rhodamnia argentea TaxID=178133 RepID=A0ABM3HX27_9MYRT|nr:WAT1-related protein At1g09380-like [Rhodamnia argentea]
MANVDFLPLLAMVIVQVGFAGMTITSKLAMDSGMSPFVLVTYRQIFATLATFPFAHFLERKTRPKITAPILLQIFLCSVTGVFMNQVFYFVGLNNSTPTIACALSNILPAITFLFALIFRQETLGIKSKAGQAKVIGTLVCVGGTMLLSFYHGPYIGIGHSRIHWTYAEKMTERHSTHKSNFLLGPVLIFASSAAWALWFIIQAKLNTKFPAPHTTTTLMCLMASIECAAVGAAVEHHVAGWSLRSGIRLISTIYAGFVCSALAICVMSWCIKRKGPLYTSIFSPLMLVITAILSWALLQEKLFVGILVGSALIIAGLYSVLWGKDMEEKQAAAEECREKEDLELQLPAQKRQQRST